MNRIQEKVRRVALMKSQLEYYKNQGQTTTVRQLMYDLIGSAYYDSSDSSYAKAVGDKKTLLGLDSFLVQSTIVDLTRSSTYRNTFKSVKEFGIRYGHLLHYDLWAGHKFRPFIIVEKRGTQNWLHDLSSEYGIYVQGLAGDPSDTYMKVIANEILHSLEPDQIPVFGYVGDYDPSGLLTIEAGAKSKLSYYWVNTDHWQRLGVTEEEFEGGGLASQPLKEGATMNDSFIQLTGGLDYAVEVEALGLETILERVEEFIESYIEYDLFEENREKTEEMQEELISTNN